MVNNEANKKKKGVLKKASKQAQADRDKEKTERKKEREEFFQAQEKMLAHIKNIENELVKTRIREEKAEEASRLKQLRREKRNRPKNPSSAYGNILIF